MTSKIHFIVKVSMMTLLSVFSQMLLAKPDMNIIDATVYEIHQALKSHQITCEQLTHMYLTRIKQYDLSVAHGKAPINAFTEINTHALDEARALDNSFAATGKFSGPLYCIPVVVKDNIDTYDMTASSGSLALLGNQPIQDAFIVKQLRAAGAIIIGKGNMDEFASGTAGISGRVGRTGNVYNTAQNSGGSSAGPAAAVSANFAMLGIGTDNSGSVRIPAGFNGIIGLRPSTGLISQTGIFPRGNMDGIAGPMARTVSDLAILLDILAKPDVHDAKTLTIKRPLSYQAFLDINGLRGKRIGLIKSAGSISPFASLPATSASAIQQAATQMQSLGATVVANIEIKDFDEDRQYNQAGEATDVNAYLASFPSVRKNYRDLCASGRTETFGTESHCLSFVNKNLATAMQDAQKARAIFAHNRAAIEAVMVQYKLDALLIPMTSQASATYRDDAFTNETIASNAGLPALTLPIGYTPQGLPISIELIGKQYDEGQLISIAYAYQQQSSPRRIPEMPTPSETLLNMTIPQINNLLTLIGYTGYMQYLAGQKQQDFSKTLTPTVFSHLVTLVLEKVNTNN